jgi:hypothetical protein
VGVLRQFGVGFPLSGEDLVEAKLPGFCFKFFERCMGHDVSWVEGNP